MLLNRRLRNLLKHLFEGKIKKDFTIFQVHVVNLANNECFATKGALGLEGVPGHEAKDPMVPSHD